MKGLALRLLALGLVLGLLPYGCKKKATEPEETDEDALRTLVSESDWFDTESHFGEEDTSGEGSLSPITPVFWWRELTLPVERTVTIEVVGDSAFVTVVADVAGYFNIIVDSEPDTVVHKVLGDTVRRYAIFKRYAEETQHRGWRLYKVSGAESVSDVNTVEIDSVHLLSTSYDTMLTDPLALFLVEDALTFGLGEECSLTVYAGDPSAFVFLHAFRLLRHRRWRFHNDGGGVYSGVWFAPLRAGIHHAALDMIQHETLLDDTYPYDSNCWLMPYKVE